MVFGCRDAPMTAIEDGLRSASRAPVLAGDGFNACGTDGVAIGLTQAVIEYPVITAWPSALRFVAAARARSQAMTANPVREPLTDRRFDDELEPFENRSPQLITRAALLEFMRANRYVVESSVHAGGGPQSAVVGVAVSDDFEVVFDTMESSRKAQNLRLKPEIAIVFRGVLPDDERTVQLEGVADEPTGADRARLMDLYFGVFPDGRERQTWEGLIYVRAKPTWVRYSDYSHDPTEIVEFDPAALKELK